MIRAARVTALVAHPCVQWQEKRRVLRRGRQAISEATLARRSLLARHRGVDAKKAYAGQNEANSEVAFFQARQYSGVLIFCLMIKLII